MLSLASRRYRRSECERFSIHQGPEHKKWHTLSICTMTQGLHLESMLAPDHR